MPNACLVLGEKRKFHGGIYQWQPSKYKSQINYSYRNEQSVQIQTDDPCQSIAIQPWMKDRQTQNGTTSPGATSNMHHMILAHIIVIAGAATGLVISSLVPPAGINCRHCGELAILVTWMVSAYIDILFSKVFSLHGEPLKSFKWSVQSSTMLFWTTFVKDIVFTGATMGGIILTQWGILNRCECYSNWGRTGIALPQTPDVSMVLKERINTWYPAITGIGLCFQLILVSSYITWQYGSALRVYIQRDDDKSNTPDWLKRVGRCGRSVLSKKNRDQNSNGRRTNKRIDTSSLERGGSAGGIPLEVQAQKPGASGPDAPLLAVKSRFEHAARAI